MKILMVNKYLYEKGGAESYFLKIGKYLEKKGIEVEYFGMYDENNTVSNKSNQYTSNMDFHDKRVGRILYPFKIIYSFEARRAIGKIIKEFNPNVIHLNNINFQLTPAIIEEAYKYKIPIIQTVHDYQMLCPNHLMFDSHSLKPCDRCINESKWTCAKKKCIHDSRIKSIIGSLEAILYKNRRTYELVDKFICPSQFMENKLLENSSYIGKTVMLHNFIEEIYDNEQVEKEDYVLYFGRLSEEKGFEMFLNSCKKLKNIKFIVAGTGPMDYMCQGIENIDFVGFKTGKELDDLIGKAWFSVYPSLCNENCPMSILESEALGTPILATKMGGIPELIEDGKNGILIDNPTEQDLCVAIEKLYENKKLLLFMRENCLKKRMERKTLEVYCNELLGHYSAVLKKISN